MATGGASTGNLCRSGAASSPIQEPRATCMTEISPRTAHPSHPHSHSQHAHSPPWGRKALTANVGFHPATQQFFRAGGTCSFLLRKQTGRTRPLSRIAVSVFRRARLLARVASSKSSWRMMVLTGYSSWEITLASMLAMPTMATADFLEGARES